MKTVLLSPSLPLMGQSYASSPTRLNTPSSHQSTALQFGCVACLAGYDKAIKNIENKVKANQGGNPFPSWKMGDLFAGKSQKLDHASATRLGRLSIEEALFAKMHARHIQVSGNTPSYTGQLDHPICAAVYIGTLNANGLNNESLVNVFKKINPNTPPLTLALQHKVDLQDGNLLRAIDPTNTTGFLVVGPMPQRQHDLLIPIVREWPGLEQGDLASAGVANVLEKCIRSGNQTQQVIVAAESYQTDLKAFLSSLKASKIDIPQLPQLQNRPGLEVYSINVGQLKSELARKRISLNEEKALLEGILEQGGIGKFRIT